MLGHLARREGSEPADPVLQVLRVGREDQDDVAAVVDDVKDGDDARVGQVPEYLRLPPQPLTGEVHLGGGAGQGHPLGRYPVPRWRRWPARPPRSPPRPNTPTTSYPMSVTVDARLGSGSVVRRAPSLVRRTPSAACPAQPAVGHLIGRVSGQEPQASGAGVPGVHDGGATDEVLEGAPVPAQQDEQERRSRVSGS